MKQIALILLLSFSIFGAKIGRQATDSVAEYTGLSEYIAARVDSNKTFYVAKPVVVTANTTLEKNLILGGVVNNATITVNEGVTLTINAAGEDFQDSCFRGSGSIVFTACAIKRFHTGWIGSQLLTVSVTDCTRDTMKVYSAQLTTMGVGAAEITQLTSDSIRGRTGRFDSLRCTRLYSTSNISASSITAARLTLQTDSLYSNLKIPGVSTHALLDVGTMLIHSGKYNNPTGNIYNNVDYNNGPYSAYPGRSHRLRMSGSSIYLSISPSAAAAGESVSFYDLARIDSLYSWLRGPVAINKNSAAASGYALDVNGRILAGDRITLKDLYTDNYARIYTQAATPGGNNSIWIDSLVTANTIVLNRRKMYGSGTSDTIAEIEQIRDCYHIRGGNPWYDGLGAVTNSYIDNFKSIQSDSAHFRTIDIGTRIDTARSAERSDYSDEAYYAQLAGEAEYAQQVYLSSNVYISSDDTVKVAGSSGIILSTEGNVQITGDNIEFTGDVSIPAPYLSGKSAIDSTEIEHVKLGGIMLTENVRNTAGVVNMTTSSMRDKSVLILQGAGNWDILAQTGTVVYVESNASGVYVNTTTGQNTTGVAIPNGHSAMLLCRLYTGSVSNWNVWISEY